MEQQGNSRWFSNRTCEYFPCHQGADPEQFNCLFCYCPLYVLGDACGGTVRYTAEGIKDCSACLLPHGPQGYGHILAKFPQIAARMAPREKPL